MKKSDWNQSEQNQWLKSEWLKSEFLQITASSIELFLFTNAGVVEFALLLHFALFHVFCSILAIFPDFCIISALFRHVFELFLWIWWFHMIFFLFSGVKDHHLRTSALGCLSTWLHYHCWIGTWLPDHLVALSLLDWHMVAWALGCIITVGLAHGCLSTWLHHHCYWWHMVAWALGCIITLGLAHGCLSTWLHHHCYWWHMVAWALGCIITVGLAHGCLSTWLHHHCYWWHMVALAHGCIGTWLHMCCYHVFLQVCTPLERWHKTWIEKNHALLGCRSCTIDWLRWYDKDFVKLQNGKTKSVQRWVDQTFWTLVEKEG